MGTLVHPCCFFATLMVTYEPHQHQRNIHVLCFRMSKFGHDNAFRVERIGWASSRPKQNMISQMRGCVVSVISIDELLYVPGYWIRGSCTSHTGDRGNHSRWHGAYESLLYVASQTIVWCARFQSLSECFWLRIGSIDMYTHGLVWKWCTPSSNAYHSSPSDTFLIKMRFGGISHFQAP